MKKFFLLALILFSSLTFGQKLKVTPNGLRNSEDSEKSFVVIPVEGKTAKQLYYDTEKYINKNYKNPEDVIKGKIEGEFLHFVTYAPKFIELKNSFVYVPVNAKYTIELNFKEGKVKYEIIELEMYDDNRNTIFFSGNRLFSFFIYNKKGELKREDVKNNIEEYFNKNLSSLTNFLKAKTPEDKW